MSGPILAVAQAPSLPGRILENVEQAIALIRNAAGEGAGYVVLPELFLSGYDVQGIIDRPDLHVLALDDVPCRRLQEACANKRIVAVIGGAFALEDGVANGALVIARDGRVAHVYRKVHLWGNENDAFVAGRRPTLLSFSDLCIGMAICFDAGFPEHMRALALAGADVIVCPAAFADNDERRRYELYFPTRALENTVYVAVANAIGDQGGVRMFGESLLIGPRGNELGRIRTATGIECMPIDRDQIARSRADLPYLSGLWRCENAPLTIEWS
jgi:5-aminopentanamidase